jgi:hypothetical protein
MTLDDASNIATIFGLFIGLPIGGFKIWRKLDQRLTEQDKQLIRINYQLWENGGNSMKDQVNTLVTDVAVLKANK